MKERLLYVDYVKAIAMILVIMGHVNFANHEIKAWIYSFHMPVFFFVTGYVLRINGGVNVVRKYFIRLMIPYLLWALLFAKFSIPNFSKILYGSYSAISQSGALTSLWFLPVMYVAILLYLLTKRVLRIIEFNRKWVLLFVGVIALCVGFILPRNSIGYPWSLNVAFVAYTMIILGSLLWPFMDDLRNKFKSNKSIGVSLCILLFLLFLAGTMFYSNNIPEKGYVLMGNARYGDPYIFTITSMCGIFMLFSFSVMLEILIPKGVRFLSFVGQNTLCIFVVQKPIISIFSILFMYVHVPDCLALLCTTLCTLLLTCVFCMIINKYAPVSVGKQSVR